jgi:carboxymethylenebutenolidase
LLEKLIEYNKPVTIKVYSGTYHAFFNNTRPQIYNEKASNDAWEMSLKFFESNLF